HAHVRKGDFLLLVGTTKGAFILRSNAQRSRWEVGGPYFHGHTVYALAYDGRGSRHRIWASTQSYWGTLLRSSEDFGKSWTNPQQASIRFPPDTGVSLKNIWQITLGRPEEPDVLYCGVEPAALFESRDAGETWSLVRGLFDHPHRPGRLFLQNHWGLYRSDNCAETWTDIANGVPSDFGFAVVIHPKNPDWVYVVPVESDEFRCACEGRLRVYRTRNAGASWEP